MRQVYAIARRVATVRALGLLRLCAVLVVTVTAVTLTNDVTAVFAALLSVIWANGLVRALTGLNRGGDG